MEALQSEINEIMKNFSKTAKIEHNTTRTL